MRGNIDALKDVLARYRADDSVRYPVRMWDATLQDAAENGHKSHMAHHDAMPYIPPPVFDEVATRFSPPRILDVGCLGGHGLYDTKTRYKLESSSMTGVDINPRYVEMSKELAAYWSGATSVDFICATAEKMPLPDASFDLVVARLVLPYVDIKATLREFRRVASAHAMLLIQIHSMSYYWHQLRKTKFSKTSLYYIRPILSGLFFRVRNAQFKHLWWKETAFSRAFLIKECNSLGFSLFWQNQGSYRGRPILGFQSSG